MLSGAICLAMIGAAIAALVWWFWRRFIVRRSTMSDRNAEGLQAATSIFAGVAVLMTVRGTWADILMIAALGLIFLFNGLQGFRRYREMSDERAGHAGPAKARSV